MLRPEAETPEGRLEAELSRLWAQYREALPEPEPRPEFLPEVWRRIEARRSSARDLRRLAQGFVTAAALVSLLIGLFLSVPNGQASGFYSNTYLELLAAEEAQDSPGDVDLVRAERISYETPR